MRIDGEWFLCDDGVVRPIFRGEILADDGSWHKLSLLADTGADGTAFSADMLATVPLHHLANPQQLGGVGGAVTSVLVNTKIRLKREDGTKITVQGVFAAFPDPGALDMSVLGRDVSNLFALIVDRPGNVVCLLGGRHAYVIGTTGP
jgi:hypothetical protein